MPKPLDPATLPEPVARFAQAEVAAGHYANVEDVLAAGVEALRERALSEQEWIDYARKEAEEGFGELDRGEGLVRGTPAEVMAHVRAEVVARLAGRAPK
jgi:Arc/MetJ-type ribon-helix-helix transcriptional regulator